MTGLRSFLWSIPICISLLVLMVPAAGADIYYFEDFDDAVPDEYPPPLDTCWEDYYIPEPHDTPLCMSGRTLRSHDFMYNTIFGINLRACTAATLHYTYYEIVESGSVLRRATSPNPIDCNGMYVWNTVESHGGSLGQCHHAAIPLVPETVNYLQVYRMAGENPIWFDDWYLEADCPFLCRSQLAADFGSVMSYETVCDEFPDLFRECRGAGPFISGGGDCAGTADYVMLLGTGYPYSSVQTTCRDLTGLAAGSLSYSYTWNGPEYLSPAVEISTDGGDTWAYLTELHPETGGACEEACADLGPYLGEPNVRFRFTSMTTSTDYTATFDDIVLRRGLPCPAAGAFTLDLDLTHAAGTLTLAFTVGAPEPATWANYLVLTDPTVQVIPLWTVPLPVLEPPVYFPVSFPLAGLGWVGVYSGLYTAAGEEISVLEWADTGP